MSEERLSQISVAFEKSLNCITSAYYHKNMFFHGLSFVVELLHAIDKDKPRSEQVFRREKPNSIYENC